MTKLTKEEQELSHALDEALSKTPAKFSSRALEGRYRIAIDPEADWLFAVTSAVLINNPDISSDALYAEIDDRVARAGGLELAAAVADAEFEEKH